MSVSRDALNSQIFTSALGLAPRALAVMVRTLAGIRNPQMGRARRLVRRKYLGRVPKVCQIRGAVNNWQLMERLRDFQMLNERPCRVGCQSRICGNTSMMPAQAR